MFKTSSTPQRIARKRRKDNSNYLGAGIAIGTGVRRRFQFLEPSGNEFAVCSE